MKKFYVSDRRNGTVEIFTDIERLTSYLAPRCISLSMVIDDIALEGRCIIDCLEITMAIEG